MPEGRLPEVIEGEERGERRGVERRSKRGEPGVCDLHVGVDRESRRGRE